MARVFKNCKKIHRILLKMKMDEIDESDLLKIIQNVTLVNESTAKRYARDLVRFGFLKRDRYFNFLVNEKREKIV